MKLIELSGNEWNPVGLGSPEPAKATPLSKIPEAKDWLVYKNQGAIRSQPLKGELVDAMSFLPELGVTMEVFSGGQPSDGVHGVDRTGSHRHDLGGSGDVFFYKDGRRLDWANEADLPIFTEIVRRARRNGITGIGAGPGYMQPGSMHIGFGNEAVWGAGGKGANAPEWLKSAYNSYDQDTPPWPGQAATTPDVGRRIMSDMMRDFGLTREQAAAFAGNFDHESGGFQYLQEINPQVPGSRGGLGFAMWTGPRRKRFEEYVEANNLDPASYKANYGFLKHEIQNDPYEAKQFAKVLNAKTVDEATKAVSDLYLRPGTPNIQSRLERAQAYLDGDDTVSIATHDGAVDPGQANKQIELSPEEWKPVGAEPWKAADTSPVEPPTADPSTSQTPPPQDQKLQDQFDALEKDAPGRYKVIPEDQYEAWKADWDAQNQSAGVVGDTKRLLNAGWAGLGLGVREAVNAIPGVGDDIVYALDSVDEWMNGQKSEAYLGGQIDKAVATLTPATREARGKHWWDEEKNRPGAAWSDPRSYFAGVVESVPSMVATMGPSMTLARGAYVSAIASGASQRVAAASAARTAMVAGAVSEGIIGGGQAALSVRQQIEQMPRQALEDSAAVKQLMESGMSVDEAVDAIADDAATQAFVIAGTATGVFGGFGDRVLAKIVADGVGGNVAQRIVQGAVKEGVAEGVLEEAPQEALSQLGENIAMKNTVDPDRDLTEGVANAAAGGVAVGGAMGAGMGAGGAAMSPRTPDSGFTPDITPKKGVLAEAMDHGARETAAATGSTFIINDPAFDDSPAGPLNGVEVALASDQSGIAQGMKRVTLPDGKTHVVGQRLLLPKEPVNMAPPQAEGETTASDVAAVSEDIPEGAPAAGTDVRIKLPDGAEIMARVEGYADGEAIVMDAGTGEVLQVPLSDIELSPAGTAAAAAEPVAVAKEQRSQQGEPIPDDVPGTEPIPQEQTTGELPPASESAPVADVPYRTPQPGQRVIVAADGIERFPGTVQSYEDGAEEALIRRDDGSEVQVPVSDLRVSKLTDKQIEKQELKENPPVERETITDKEPTAREVVSKQVLLPDTKHARLYDLGKLRRDSKRTIGAGTLDMDAVSPGEQSRLADEFGVSPQRLGQIADDYRYRVERAAKDAKSRLPFKMWPVNEKMLGRMKDEDRKEAATDDAFPVPEPMDEGTKVLENDWDKLPVEAKKAVLTAAKVKRAPSTRWADFPANIRKKLEASLQVSNSDEAVPEVTPVKEVPAAPVTPPSFEDFKASLPKDAEGYPDLTGVGSAVIGEISGGTTTAWNGLKTDEQRAKAIALANVRTAAKPKPADTLETAAQEAATSPANDRPEPTQAQKEAGNYKLGHVKLGGFDISIENPQGSKRKGVDPNGKPWSVTMKSHYGYFKGTVGKDKDHIDTFIRPGTDTLADSDPVFVIDQVNPDTKRFDEHKIMLGFKTRQAAERAYKENYAKGWKGLGTIVRTNVGELKDWFANGDTSKPFTKRGKPADQSSATKPEKQPDLSTRTRADTNGGLNSDDVKSVLRSKEWKKVFGSTTNINAETDFYAHPESEVAFDQAAGWLDAKAGRPPREQKPFTPVHSSAFNPRNAYLEAYWGAKHGEARQVRASEAVDVQRELTDEKPSGGPQQPDKTDNSEGFNVEAFHGTGVVFDDFDPLKLGSNTGAPSALEGFFFAKSPETASAYLKDGDLVVYSDLHDVSPEDAARLPQSVRDKISAAQAASQRASDARDVHDYDAEENYSEESSRLWDEAHAEAKEYLTEGNNIRPVKLRMKNPYVHDFKGKKYRAQSYSAVIKIAKARGHDSVVLKNTIDGGPVDDIYVVFDKKNIRSKYEPESLSSEKAKKRPAKNDTIEVKTEPDGRQRMFSVAPKSKKAFQKWFGDSKVLDENGDPLVVFHGTGQNFEAFDPQNPMTVGGMDLETAGIKANFFTSNEEVAWQFAEASAVGDEVQERVISAYLKIEKPYVVYANGRPWTKFEDEVIAALKEGIHDGVIMYRVEDGFFDGAISDVYIVPSSNQIKSVDNVGNFDPSDGRIRYSQTREPQRALADLRSELKRGPVGTFVDRLLKDGVVRIVEARPTDVPDNVQAWTDPDGTITLMAPAIAEGTGTAVLLHEALHSGRDALVERKVWQALEKRLASLYRQHSRSAGRAKEFFDAARERIQAAGVQEKDRIEEFGAYAIEEYEKAPKILQRWADDAIGAVKSWALRRFGRQLGAVTPAQLRALAISALKDKSRPSPVVKTSVGGDREIMFSRKVDKAEVKDQIAGRWTDLSPKLLSLVPLNYFEEMKRPGMDAVTKYMKVKRSMDTYRSEKHEAMDKVAQDWRKFASRNRKGAAELASLMHDTTRMSIDPSITYEGKEPAGYTELKARFDALPPAARALYKTVRNGYVKMQKEMDQLILDNVEKAQKINEKEAKKRYEAAKQKLDRDRTIDDLERREKAEELAAKYKADMTKSRWAAKARLTRLRQTFEKNRVPAPYFPLARFGDYFVSVRDMAGDIVSFSRFESDADRRRWLRANKAEIESEYPGVVFEQGVLGNSAAVRQAMDPRLVAEIDGILKDANVDAEVMDAIYQKWLQSMPDLSVRKRYIHRKGTSGFHQDALRAFASHMFHAGHQMGKLKYGIDLQEAVDDARDQAKSSDDPTRAGQLVNELSLRHEWVMNPKGSKFAQKVNSAAFVWYLAATPAAAIINMTQPILFGIPVLGAKLGGVTKASAALMKASTDVMYGKGDIINGRLTSDEKRAIQDLYASGSIDRTMAMEIAGIGDSGVAYSPLRHAVMTKISWMFHRAEVVNREVTALAAYRMARAKGMSHEKAVDVAHELNFTVNYDYANSSRPRILQSDFAKVAGVFMSYQLNVWYRIFRDIHQSFAGDTPQARKEARYQLAGLMGVQTLIGGTSGFFGYNVLMALAGMFFDDDDDPFSFKHEAERAIYDLFGANVGGMIINGVPGHLTGVDLTSRIGMADFFLRMPEGSKEGKDWWLEFVAGSLGASVGAVGNAIVGMHYMSEGDTARGLELMAPKAIKDAMKAWRYNNEGLLTRKGDVILPREDINAWNVIAQMSGFTPAKIATAHKLRGRKYEAQNKIKDERSALINRFATSIRNGDADARKRVIEQIKAWNKRSYAKTLPITKEVLERSLKTRARLSARREDGFLPINEKVGHYLSKRTPENPYR